MHTCAPNEKFSNIHCSIIANSPKLAITKMFINNKIFK